MHPAVLGLLLIVRIYDSAGLSAAGASSGPRIAAEILQQAGVETAWVFCGSTGRPMPPDPVPCGETPAPSTLVIRMVRRPPGRRTGDALGDAYVDTAGGDGTLVTIYLDRVIAVARNARIDVSTVVGRTIAHEVGHLLLGTAAHAGQGLMRAQWSTATLQDPSDGHWQFSKLEAKLLIENLMARDQRARNTQPGLVAEPTLPANVRTPPAAPVSKRARSAAAEDQLDRSWPRTKP